MKLHYCIVTYLKHELICDNFVGTNRFFNMALVLEKLSDMNRTIPVNSIWNHLESMYDVDILNETEMLHATVEDFNLPSADFSELMKTRSTNEDNKTMLNKQINKIKLEVKDSSKTGIKREEKVAKSTPRRDSTYKESILKVNITPKTVVKPEVEKKSASKSRTRKNSDKSISPVPSNANRIGRNTRGSLKPEENTSTRSRSPISNAKRRTRTDLK